MQYTVDTLMALHHAATAAAVQYADCARVSLRSERTMQAADDRDDANDALRAALTEALAQPVRDDEFATRGELAARLKCWHRLTREESDELVDLLRAQPVREPLSDDDIADIWDSWLINITDKISAMQFAREIEKAHGIGGDK